MKQFILIMGVALSFGCTPTPESTQETETASGIDRFPARGAWTDHTVAIPADVATSEGVEVELADRTPTPVELDRVRKRMNLDQLDSAFFQVSGGQRWTEGTGRNEVNLFVRLSATLGKPDFIQNTKENLEPSALFQKFLGDAARSVCAKMLAQDLSGDAEPILLAADETDEVIRSNVQRLLRRFHSRELPLDSPDVDQWLWLFDSVRFIEDTDTGWNAVCVALFTHPDFYTY